MRGREADFFLFLFQPHIVFLYSGAEKQEGVFPVHRRQWVKDCRVKKVLPLFKRTTVDPQPTIKHWNEPEQSLVTLPVEGTASPNVLNRKT